MPKAYDSKKNKNKLFLILMVAILSFLTVGIYQAFFDFSLDKFDGKGEKEYTLDSPNKKYRATVYTWSEGGATVGYSMRIGIESLKDKNFVDKTVFWQYKFDTTKIKWLDNHKFQYLDIIVDVENPKTYYNWKK